MMFLLGLLLATEAPAPAPCLGVAMPTSSGGEANLMWVEARGDVESLKKLAGAAKALGLEDSRLEVRPDGTLTVPFVSPPITTAKATDLVMRLRRGDFGPLADKLMISGIDTLPVDKCPR